MVESYVFIYILNLGFKYEHSILRLAGNLPFSQNY